VQARLRSPAADLGAVNPTIPYDGSWTEWGSVIGAPIDNPSAQK
jgi:hypothetical protein